MIEEEIVARGWPRAAVEAEAKEIIATMGHNFQLTTVRAIGYGLTKVIKVRRSHTFLLDNRFPLDIITSLAHFRSARGFSTILFWLTHVLC